MVAGVTKVLLFLSSYLPLWIVLIIVNGRQLGWLVLAPIGALIGGVIGLIALFKWVRSESAVPLVIGAVERNDIENVTYVVTYLFPFVGNYLTDQTTAAGLAILFVFVMAVYVRADLIHINPVLTLLGWHIYRIESVDGNELILMSDQKGVKRGSTLAVVRVAEGLWRERPGGNGARSLPKSVKRGEP